MSWFIKTLLVNTSWLDLHITDTHTQKHMRQAQDSIRDVMHSRWMQSEVVNTGQWRSDEDKPDSYINTGQAFMLNNGSSFWCTLSNHLLQIDSHGGKHFWWHKQKKSRANTVMQGYANGSWIDTITATPFQQSFCLALSIGLYQIQYGPPCLAPPYSYSECQFRRNKCCHGNRQAVDSS